MKLGLSMLGLLGFLSNPHICCFRMEPSRSERGQLFWYPAKLRDEIIFRSLRLFRVFLRR